MTFVTYQWPDNCDCWTDTEGYWQLGPKCRAAELDEWRRMLDRMPYILDMLRDAGSKREPDDVQ